MSFGNNRTLSLPTTRRDVKSLVVLNQNVQGTTSSVYYDGSNHTELRSSKKIYIMLNYKFTKDNRNDGTTRKGYDYIYLLHNINV